jgi:hypothetical protein
MFYNEKSMLEAGKHALRFVAVLVITAGCCARLVISII